MAKTGKAYICRRSTNRKLYRSKCEGCFHFLFLPRCRLQGGFLFLRFPRGQRIMAKTGKAYKCRRSTSRRLYCSKCEFSFFVSPKVLSPGRASYSYVFQEANASWPKLESLYMQEKYEQKIILFEMRVFIFCFSQGVVSREASYSYVFQEANAFMAKTGKAYKCRRSTSRRLYCSKCEFSFFVSPKVLSPGRLLILTFSKRPTLHGQNWKSLYMQEKYEQKIILFEMRVFIFLFLPRCCLQGGFLFLRFPRGQRFMAKTGKAYKCRRSTSRRLYCSKCEFSFFVSPKVLSPGRLLILTFSKRPTLHGQNWKSLYMRRSTSRRLYCSKCEFSFFVSPKVLSPGRLLILTFSKRPTLHGQNWKSL